MKSFTQKMNKLATAAVRGKSNPRSSTGGVQRKGWAFNARHNIPSACRSIPVEQYLATR